MMPYAVENPMVTDTLWELVEKSAPANDVLREEKLRGSGWEEIGTGTFVPEKDAYRYAMERISQDEDLKRELVEMVVEWFYSGNWVREDGRETYT